METKVLKPVAAFDIISGNATAMQSDWPELEMASGYRWIHLDLAEPETRTWANERLPAIAARALCQSETRPRCERLEDGLILNLRAVNLNPESNPEDMVSLRMWVTKDAIVTARMRKVWALDAIRKDAGKGTAPASVGKFLEELAHGLTNRIETVSLGLEEKTDELMKIVTDYLDMRLEMDGVRSPPEK